MLNENQHKLLASPKVQDLIKAFDATPTDTGFQRRADIHQRVESWFSELDKKNKHEENSK